MSSVPMKYNLAIICEMFTIFPTLLFQTITKFRSGHRSNIFSAKFMALSSDREVSNQLWISAWNLSLNFNWCVVFK